MGKVPRNESEKLLDNLGAACQKDVMKTSGK
jgi:hypothetical protein